MQFINYLSVSAISFFGLFVGMMLIKIAPEEKKILEKSFSLSRKIFLLLILFFLIGYYFSRISYLMLLLSSFVFLLFVEFLITDFIKKSALNYLVLGALFFLSSKNTSLFAIESSLILLYGIPTASLIYNIKKKNFFNVLFYNAAFLIAANALFISLN